MEGSSLNHFISPLLRCTAGPWGPPSLPGPCEHPPEEGAETSGSCSASTGLQGDISQVTAAPVQISQHVALPQDPSPLPH